MTLAAQANDEASPPVTVLVVDDNAAKRLALRAVLLPLGYSLVEADSGLAALRCLMAQNFAVILLDVRMPIMGGFETAAHIRLRRQSEMTPIIFITAHGGDEIVTDRYAEGAVDFLFAPVQPDELRAKVSFFANLFLRAEALAEQARGVQATADQLRSLTDAAPIGIFQTDAENRYVYTNPRWTDITGIRQVDALGRRWDTIVSADQRAGIAAEMTSGVGSRTELSHRFEISVPNSAPRIVLVHSRSMSHRDGETEGWVGTLADITAEAGAEAAMSAARDEATKASRLKSDFLANMSHEIRTPMNGVIGMTDLLLETDLGAVQRDYAQTVRNSGEALLTINNDILDFSKVEAGMLEIEDLEFDVRSVVDGVTHLLAGSARAKGLELLVQLDGAVPDVVSGDPGRLRQVLTNLIGNAIKFTRDGEIVLRVTQAEVAGDDAVIRFEVSDTGDGITEENLGLVFAPFVQADTSNSRRYAGTGLGLAISSQLVELMGGQIGASSTIGLGSTFWFTICVHTDANKSGGVPESVEGEEGAGVSATVPKPARAADRGQGGIPIGRLLLAEDNLINQKVAVAMLSGAGYQVDTVLDGAAAVLAAAAHPYDVILMDAQMPDLNGYEATAAIRAQEGADRHTPIVALTAGARHEDRERCLAEGMDGYLAKPISQDALLAMVARSMNKDADSTRSTTRVGHTSAADFAIGRAEFDELRLLAEATEHDFVTDLIDQFVDDTDLLLRNLREASSIGDASAVGHIAHNIKGSGAQLGGRRLAMSCDRLEETAITGGLSHSPDDLADVERDYAELRDALTEQRLSLDKQLPGGPRA
jgi:PAS domain S-box-containing protein